MKKNSVRPIHIIAVILVLIASAVWTYNGIITETITVSYIVDAVMLILILILILGNKDKTKRSVDHDNYMNWITEGSITDYNKLTVSISDLEDLVNLAVDLGKRVIHDIKLGKYFVLAEDMTYIYTPGLTIPLLNSKQQLGKLLIDRGTITQGQLDTALFYQKRIGCKLGEALMALSFIDETVLYSSLAAQQRIDYYELDTQKEVTDTSWLAKMSVNKAQALQALPLGFREDGKRAVACGETAKAGIEIALQEILGSEIYVVAASPSCIYEILEKIKNRDKPLRKFAEILQNHKVEACERISEMEWEQFISVYNNGKIDVNIFLKATGIVDPVFIAQVPDNNASINWLIGKNVINGQIVNLMTTLNKLIHKQDRETRQSKLIPDLLDLLEESYYITGETADWVYEKSEEQDELTIQLLKNNYCVAEETIDCALLMLGSLNNLLNKPKIF